MVGRELAGQRSETVRRANLSAIVWSFAITFAIMIVLKNTIGVRVSDEAEDTGLDLSEHAETAYH